MPDAKITHKLYLDDSGNKDYSVDKKYSTKGGRTPFFAFGGLLIRPEVAGVLDAAVESLKIETFGQGDVEVKAHWLRRHEKRSELYLKPFGISDNQLDEFTNRLYGIAADTDCELIACIVDKEKVQNKYPNPYYPPAIAYECIIQRAQMAMEACGGMAHVTIDDMSDASPKGRQWKLNLERHHKKLLTYGSKLRGNMRIDRIAGSKPSFRNSAHDNRLQLADLVAYSVYRQFVDHGDDWEDDSKELPTYEYLARLVPRFRNHEGRIQGYGIARFPMGKRVKWGI